MERQPRKVSSSPAVLCLVLTDPAARVRTTSRVGCMRRSKVGGPLSVQPSMMWASTVRAGGETTGRRLSGCGGDSPLRPLGESRRQLLINNRHDRNRVGSNVTKERAGGAVELLPQDKALPPR
jgi:hypothetical protein